jgi:hypothetical protein
LAQVTALRARLRAPRRPWSPSAEAGEYVHHVPKQVVGVLTRVGTTNLRSCGLRQYLNRSRMHTSKRGPCDKMGDPRSGRHRVLLHAHLADIELTVRTTQIPLPKQHLCDMLWAVAGQSADEPATGPSLSRSWTSCVLATCWWCGSSVGWPLAAPLVETVTGLVERGIGVRSLLRRRLRETCSPSRRWIQANTCPVRVVGC